WPMTSSLLRRKICFGRILPSGAIGVAVLVPLGGVRLEQVFLCGEELVVGQERRAAHNLRNQIDQIDEVAQNNPPFHIPHSSPHSNTSRPRLKVASTTPN